MRDPPVPAARLLICHTVPGVSSSFPHCLIDQIKRHQLSDGCRRDGCIGVLLIEHLSGCGLQEYGGASIEVSMCRVQEKGKLDGKKQ